MRLITGDIKQAPNAQEGLPGVGRRAKTLSKLTGGRAVLPPLLWERGPYIQPQRAMIDLGQT